MAAKKTTKKVATKKTTKKPVAKKTMSKKATAKKTNVKTTNKTMTQDKVWETVQLSRHKDRPTAYDFIEAIFDDFIELHGDRLCADDAAIVGGIASLNGKAVTVIGQQKGRDTEENIKRRFGMPNPDGYRKSLRLMKQAEKFGRPIITFIDTPGAYPGLDGEMRGQGEAIAKNLFEMSKLEVPTIAIIIGEGGSGGALALAVSDEVWMLKNGFYSILSPEGFASILWKDGTKANEAAVLMKSTARDLYDAGLIDKMIKESSKGAQAKPDISYKDIKENLLITIPKLEKKTTGSLIKARYKKFRDFGKFEEGNK